MSNSGRDELISIHYLPRFARKAKVAKVRQIGYSVDKDPITSMITFHYTVAWTDSDDSLARRYEILKASLKKHPKMIQPEPDVALPRLIHCDGPCSTWAPEDYIVQFGLCDHNICFRCYENEESIALTDDGTHGCCNRECVERAKAELAMRTPPVEDPKLAGAMGGGHYVAYPGTNKHVTKQQTPKAEVKHRRRKSDMKSWKSNLNAVASDVSFYGYYDDDQLQELAETMRSAAADQQSRQLV